MENRKAYQRSITPERYERIRRLWIAHSLAEDRRDIPGLLDTLTADCVYEIPQSDLAWHGHEGAERFYRQLLGAFPDIHFDLRNIVIGPQGVWEEAHVTATHEGNWLDREATHRPVEFDVLIYFPWDDEQGLFAGERVWYFGLGASENGASHRQG